MLRRSLLYCALMLNVVLAFGEVRHERLTNLPHMYVETFSGKSITSKTTDVLARMWYVDEKDSVAYYDSLYIRGRGNSTWGLSKKPYRIKFFEKEKFLGKGYAKAKKWTLMANHADKTMMRNALSARIGEFAGQEFVPAAKFVDMTLNNQYIGTYQISDQIQVHKKRVDIEEQDYPLNDSSDISGGYLLEVDGFYDYIEGRTGFSSSKSVPVRIHYPDEDEIVTSQLSYIKTFLNDFESRLFGENYTNSLRGWRARSDMASLLSWYIATEVTANPDCFYSMYFYKGRGVDSIFWGPMWDYDIAYDNDTRKSTLRALMKDVAFSSTNINKYIDRMWTDEVFAKAVNEQYQSLLDKGLLKYALAQVDSLDSVLQQSQVLNYEKWGISTKAMREKVLYSTYEEYVSDLKSFLNTHTAYLTTAFKALLPGGGGEDPEPEPTTPTFPNDTSYYYSIRNANTTTAFDVNRYTYQLCCNAFDVESEGQQWRIFGLENGYYWVVNRMTGYALNDPNEGVGENEYVNNTPLNLVEPDSTDSRQWWNLTAQQNSRYNFVNAYTRHTANLSGGNRSDGTNVISYNTGSKNATSLNRMWTFAVTDSIAQEEPLPTDIQNVVPEALEGDYALAYDAVADRLHFGADDIAALRFKVVVYNQQGQQVRSFMADEGVSLQGLPKGMYMVAWTFDGRPRCVKFMR